MAQDYNLGRVQGMGWWFADATFTTSGTITLGSGFTIQPLVKDYVIDKETNNVYAIATISGSNPFNFTTSGTPIFTLGGGNKYNLIYTTSEEYFSSSYPNIEIPVGGKTYNNSLILDYPIETSNNVFYDGVKRIRILNNNDLGLSLRIYGVSDTINFTNVVKVDDYTITFDPVNYSRTSGSDSLNITNLHSLSFKNGVLTLLFDSISSKAIAGHGVSIYIKGTFYYDTGVYSVDNFYVNGDYLESNIYSRISILEQQLQAIAQIMEVDLTSLNKITTKKEE